MPSVLKFCQIFLVASLVLKNSTTVFTPAPVKTPPGKSSTACRLQVSSRDGWTLPAFLRLWEVGLGLGGAGDGLRLRLSMMGVAVRLGFVGFPRHRTAGAVWGDGQGFLAPPKGSGIECGAGRHIEV